jgi:hypothetical protein
MLYIDYTWDLSQDTIIPDSEIDTIKLNWNPGDYWQIQEYNGKIIFRKMDKLMQFVLDGNNYGHN